MCETVLTMANNQIIDLERNDQNGNSNKQYKLIANLVTEKDAQIALRICKGNIWQAVEKCIQRHQDCKGGFLQSSETATTASEIESCVARPKTRSFSLKVLGFGSGKANNDAYEDAAAVTDQDVNVEIFIEPGDQNELSNVDIFEKEIENAMVPENFTSPISTKLNGESSELQVSQRKLTINVPSTPINNHQEFYLIKNNDLINDRYQMESLIHNWHNEKLLMNNDQQQVMKQTEKYRQKIIKMIELQKKISGEYFSDGNTTEEELDREVEQVFSSEKDVILYQEMIAKLSAIENDNFDDQFEKVTFIFCFLNFYCDNSCYIIYYILYSTSYVNVNRKHVVIVVFFLSSIYINY